MIWIYLFIYSFIFGFACSYLAKSKGKKSTLWFFYRIFLGDNWIINNWIHTITNRKQ